MYIRGALCTGAVLSLAVCAGAVAAVAACALPAGGGAVFCGLLWPVAVWGAALSVGGVVGGRRIITDVGNILLINLLRRNIEDERVVQRIKRYLKSGVMENGVVMETGEGSPQDGNRKERCSMYPIRR